MKLKKFLAATLTATMVMSSAMTVCASGYYSSSSSSESESTTVAEDVQVANAPITVAGTTVRTSVAGVYAAESVQGVAVTTPLADVKASLGLKDGQVPAITIYDTDPKKSSKAMESVNLIVEAFLPGGEVLTALNIDLGARENGKWVELADGSVAMAAGLPKDADTTKTYSVICVQPGGVYEILTDEDTNPATVTFKVKAGIGTYAIVAQ